MTKELSIVDHGIMLSDYFQSTSGVMLPIYICPDTTVNNAVESLKEEINMVWDHIEYTAEYHNFPIDDLEKQINAEISEIENDVNEQGNGNNIVFDFPDGYDDEEENAVLIFSIEFE